MESLACRVLLAPAPQRRAGTSRRCAGAWRCSSGAGQEGFTPAADLTSASGRRHVLTLLGGSAVLLAGRPALADEEGGTVVEAAPAAAAPAADARLAGLPPPDDVPPGYVRYYGRATSVSSYAGYGGADDNFRYSFYYPAGWKSGTVSKVMKSTNGTDCLFSNPAKKSQQAYVVSFLGSSYERLKEDRASIINDLALSDSIILDALNFADKVEVVNKTKGGQAYVDFDILGGGDAIYVSCTSDGARLFALFVTGSDDTQGRLIRDSLVTLSLK